MPSIPPNPGSAENTQKNRLFEIFISLLIIFCCVGTPPPGVNESHYLPKAKSLWDSSYASGGDVFLNSGNTHWLTSSVAGLAARYAELSWVAWGGRFLAWSLLAVGWIRLCEVAKIHSLMRPIGLLAWFLLTQYGHWAGEWFVGGFEGKSLAYPFVLLGISSAISKRWRWAWPWLGAGIAWHPVAGGWAALTVAALWLVETDRFKRLKEDSFGLGLGFLFSMVGLLPALLGVGGNDVIDGVSAAQVHVYFRLPHHLSPQSFAAERHLAAIGMLAWLFIATALSRDPVRLRQGLRPVDSILLIAWLSVIISLMGLLIDLSVRLGFRHDLAARLLRFYFFRWSDVAVPLAIVVVMANYWTQPIGEKHEAMSSAGWRLTLRFLFVYIVVGSIGVWHWAGIMAVPVPPADLSLLRSLGPFSSEPLASSHRWELEDIEDGGNSVGLPQRYIDWLAACEWINENTPQDSLWLTPRYQQSFKWHAARAEVVNWKDVPQDNSSIIQWYQRIQRCRPPRDGNGKPRGWTTEELIDLARQYKFQWVLVDRTFQQTPPLLECKYPLLIDNRSFAVFFIPQSMLLVPAP
jgi:hypothetical protein